MVSTLSVASPDLNTGLMLYSMQEQVSNICTRPQRLWLYLATGREAVTGEAGEGGGLDVEEGGPVPGAEGGWA